MSYMLICDGDVSESSGDLICSTGWETQLATLPFDISQIDPAVATTLFASGFFLCIVPFAATFGIKVLLNTIKWF